MKKKYIPIFVIIISLCLVIFKEFGIFISQPEKMYNLSPGSESMEGEQGEKGGIDIPYEWNEVINEKNSINAVIQMPDEIRENGFREVEAKAYEIDEESILSILKGCYEPQEGIENEYVRQYVGNDDMKLFFSKEYEDFSMTCHMDDYIRMAYRDQLSIDYNRDKYAIEEAFKNFSIKECDEKIYELWNAIGIQDKLQIVHRALDYQTMQEEAFELQQDGSIIIPDYNWKEEDNSYHCSVYQICNGLPVLDSYRLNARNDILNVGNHTFVLNKDRFISMNASTIYKFEYGCNYEELISFSDILNKYRKVSELELKDYRIVITQISMRVIAIPNGENCYQMLPVWIFSGTQKDESDEYPYVMIIDALSGEEL